MACERTTAYFVLPESFAIFRKGLTLSFVMRVWRWSRCRVRRCSSSKAFQRYRASGGRRTGVLPDFFIGAHSAVARLALLTRDACPAQSLLPIAGGTAISLSAYLDWPDQGRAASTTRMIP
jgi:hypothetical protein